MKIDEKYGLFPLPKEACVPVRTFPGALLTKLMDVLLEPQKLWFGVNFNAFRVNSGMCLQVTLDTGDRPFYVHLHESGDVVQFDAPIFIDFPREASYYVLSRFGGTAMLNFGVTERSVRKGEGDGNQKLAVSRTDVLYGWRIFEFEAFVRSAGDVLPYVVAKLTKVEKELRAHLEEWPSVESLMA